MPCGIMHKATQRRSQAAKGEKKRMAYANNKGPGQPIHFDRGLHCAFTEYPNTVN